MDFSCPVILTNRNFRVKSWNRAAELIYGWPSDEAAGKNVDELLNTALTSGSIGETYAGLVSSGHAELDVRHTARNGRVLHMQGTVSLSRTGDGEITGAVFVLRPADEAQGAPDVAPAETVAGTGRGLLDMLNGLAQDVWAYDIPTNEEWHSLWTGRAGAGAQGGAVHPDDWERVDDELRQAMAGRQERFCLQYRALGPDGGYRWTMNTGRIEYDGEGRPARMYGITADISEARSGESALQDKVALLERQVAELEDKNRKMTDFFTNVSHEFKTPLSIMLVDLQLMEYRLRGAASGDLKEKLGKTVAIMRQNALRLLRLIGNLLDVTKIEAGFMKARFINADVVALASGLTESVRSYAVSAGIELKFTADRHNRLMPVDSDKLERILLNLLSNAIKHTAQGGHISVTVANSPDHVLITVKDDGEGIGEERKDFIFDRFRQVNSPLTRTTDGCGIGLSLTRALVELLKGRIWFNSAVGEGSEFCVELPVLQPDWQSQQPEVDGIPRDKKVEMELSELNKIER